ncbi:MAG: hypothetical protein ACI9EF_003522, partial [Pseudohongiellaceae bacterium]
MLRTAFLGAPAKLALLGLSLLVVACGGGGGGGGGGAAAGGGDAPGAALDPDVDFFLVEAAFARAIFGIDGELDAVQPVVNPASLFEVDPLTNVALAGFPKVLSPGSDLALLVDIDFGQLQDPLTPQIPLVPRNSAVVLEFSAAIDPLTLHFGDSIPGTLGTAGLISSASSVQVKTKTGTLVAARGLIDPTNPKRLVLLGLANSGLGWDPSPLQFDKMGTAVADPAGFLRISVGVGFGDLASAAGVDFSDRTDELGTVADPLAFNPGNSSLDAIVLQTDDGQITFNGFLPDLTEPRLVRPVVAAGTISSLIGDTVLDDSLLPLPSESANNGAGEWAGALLIVTSPSAGGVVSSQYILSGNSSTGSTTSFVLASGQSLDAVVSLGDAYVVKRTEYFEPISGPLPSDPTELARITVDPAAHPRDPNDPQDVFNSDLRYFVRMFDENGTELTSLWNPTTQTFLPVPPKSLFELSFSEAMDGPSFLPYESLTVRDATLAVTDPAFQDMRIGFIESLDSGRSVRFSPVLENQLDASGNEFLGFGGTASALRAVLRTIPEAADLENLLDSASPEVLAELLDLDDMGVRGCTDLGGRGLGLPAALLDQSDSVNFLLSPLSAGLGAFPPAVDFGFEFETEQSADPDYGVVVHRFMGQGETSIFSYDSGTVHDEVTQGVEYHDFPPADDDGDGSVDRRFIYGPTLLEVGLNVPGSLTGASAATIEHLVDKFNAPKE